MTSWNRLGILLLLAAVPLIAGAQAPADSPAPRRATLVAEAEKGAPFQSGRQTYRLVVGLRATVEGNVASPSERLAAVGVAPDALVERRGPFLLFRQPATAPTATARLAAASAVTVVDRTPTYPVAVNARTGQLGIVPGTIVARLGKVGDAAALARAGGLEVEYVAEPIGYAFFLVPDGKDVVAAAAALAADPRVQSADVEIREHFAVPN